MSALWVDRKARPVRVMVAKADGRITTVPVSTAQLEALDLAAEHGDKLQRRPFGSWCAADGTGSVQDRTVKALLAKRVLRYINCDMHTVEIAKT